MYARYVPPPKASKAAAPGAAASAARPVENAPSADQSAPPALAPPADGFSYARYVPGAQAAKAPKIQYFEDESGAPNPKRKRESADEPPASSQLGSKKAKTRGGHDGVTSTETRERLEPSGDQEAGQKKKKNRRKRKQRTKADDDDDHSQDSEEEPSLSKRAPLEPSSEEDVAPPTVAARDEKPEQPRPKMESEGTVLETVRTESTPETKDGDVDMVDAKVPAPETESAPLSASQGPEEKRGKKDRKKKQEKQQIDVGGEGEELRHKVVLERKAKSLRFASKATQGETLEPGEEPAERHDLDPLPQPAVVPDNETKPTYDTLPSWLARPIRVTQETRKPFGELGVLPRSARFLEQKGFSEAFAVQTAAIPLLLPTSAHRPGDVLISAATGSGKTLAYALPIVRDIGQGAVTRLRALVVLPTRELVKQAQDVFEICARAYDGEERKKVRIGVAVGSQSIKTEQLKLVASESRYDPEAYRQIEGEAKDRKHGLGTSRPDGDNDSLDPGADSAGGKDPRLGAWEGEVVDFSSMVDVLICTPGRLVEHVEQTAGFSLDHVRWLVVDEADKLLAQSFQGWLGVVMGRFRASSFGARDFPDMEYAGVRKVILSATLTRDLSLLGQLELRRPRLIVLEGEGEGANAGAAEHTLPTSLREFAVRVHEPSLKPLYLLRLLRGQHMTRAGLSTGDDAMASKQEDASDSDSDSGSGPDSSESTSDSTSDSESDSDTSSAGSSTAGASEPEASASGAAESRLPHCLIFTKSNESALRLARLLVLLDASLTTRVSTLTSTTATHARRKTLRAFTTASSPVRLVIASDLVARGIDIPRLGHVVNYDLPASVAGYVHRVGRTARAGRDGCAWTLVADDESGWFWGKIAKGRGVRRAQRVERTRIDEMGEEQTKQYEEALAKLGREALEMKRG
ncbi:hypothetical protein CDD83_2101 [Cordyceps sp. RAO-2017]|nr:hypothetical protein CDD83_2101 [Cordyceps sp. RAO-2017]